MKRIRIDFDESHGPKGLGTQLAGVIRGTFFNDPDGQQRALDAMVAKFKTATLKQSASPDAPPVRGESASKKEPAWKTPKSSEGLF